MAIYDFFLSRNSSPVTANTYIGHAGRLFYDSDNGVVKLSDGTTPGGLSIPYTIATSTVIGGIKAGPGANVSVDGTLTIDTTGLPLGIGNIQINDTTLSAVNADADIVVAANGTGNVELIGNIHFHTTASGGVGDPFFNASSDGQITILVPAADPAAGAVKIVGSQTGRVIAPMNTGVMLQLTGNNNDPSRLYNDAINSFPAYVGRRINGNITVPTAVVAGDDLLRISVTGHNGVTVPGSGAARILFQATETHTPTAAGANISIFTTSTGSNVLAKTATFDSASGLTVTRATVQGNLTVQGNIIGNATTTTATIGTANIGNVNVGTSGTVTTPRVVINDGGIRAIQDGTAATIDFSKDSMILWYRPSGTGTVTLANYVAGTTVRLHINIGPTSRDINYGVAAGSNSSTGATSFNGSGAGAVDISDTTMQLVYTCYDGTAANTYVAVTTV